MGGSYGSDSSDGSGIAVGLSTPPAPLPGLHFMLHCDTDQEYSDHSARMAFVGPPDTAHVNVGFFPPPPPGYGGPGGRQADGGRRTGPTHVFSMGEMWARCELGGHGGSSELYGAQDRGSEQQQQRRQQQQQQWVGAGSPPLPALFLPHGSPPVPIEPCRSGDWLAR